MGAAEKGEQSADRPEKGASKGCGSPPPRRWRRGADARAAEASYPFRVLGEGGWRGRGGGAGGGDMGGACERGGRMEQGCWPGLRSRGWRRRWRGVRF